MARSHLAAAVLICAALFGGAARADYFSDIYNYSSPLWYGGGSWDTIPTVFEPRYDSGYSAGYPNGYRSGFSEGQVRGRSEGWTNGKSAGHSVGWDEAYPLAFDIAYDEAYPSAHRAGWVDGVSEGFQEGYDYAPVVAEEIINYWYGGGGASGSLVLTGINMYGSTIHFSNLGFSTISDANYSIWRDRLDVDWAKLSFEEGYKKGHAAGYTVGSTDGYDDTYGATYEQAFPIGHQLGIWEGTAAGKLEGQDQGSDEGSEAGYDLGFNEGFYAGIDYRIFGDFVRPKYSFQYTRRSDAAMRGALVAMNAPEPGSALLLAVGGVFAAGARRRRHS